MRKTKPKITFASNEKVSKVKDIMDDFMKLLGFRKGDYIITDESSLGDFAPRIKVIYPSMSIFIKRVKEKYNIEIEKDELLISIFQKIKNNYAKDN